MNMFKKLYRSLQQMLKRIVRELLKVSSLRFTVLFLVVAVLVSVMIVMTIDLLWDGRFNAELEFAGVLTPFLDGLLLVLFVNAMLDEIREEVVRRKVAEDEIRRLNQELEAKVQERSQQLLQAQAELVRKERLAVLGQVAGSVGHELRNPLGVMSNAVYFLQTVLADADDGIKEYLDIIKSEIADSERIVSDLLDSVRAKAPHPEAVAARELVDLTLRKYHVPSCVTLKIDIPEALPPLQVDAMQMHQVLRNLVSNSVEAMPQGGTLEIWALENKPHDSITLSVRDSGSGIAPELRPKLFQPLFTTKPRGVGLGLVVVKNLTEANGGTVQVKSEPGQGTTFTLVLPV